MSDWHARPDLIDLADKINETHLQRPNGVEFLSRPRTYSAGDMPACWECRVVPERIRVGRPDEVVDFSGPRITVSCEPCGHHMSISPDEASLVLEHGRQKRRFRATCAVLHTNAQGNAIPCPDDGQAEPEEADQEYDEGRQEAPSEGELNPVLPVRPDPRQPAYDAVYEYIRGLGGYLPPDPVHRNAIIWRAVQAALEATPVGRCVSSHCVEGGHILPIEGEAP